MARVYKRLFSMPLNVYPFLQRDQYNNYIYGDPVQYMARQEVKTEEGHFASGDELLLRSVIAVYGDANIKEQDKLELIDGEQFKTLQVFKQRGPKNKVDYVLVVVGRFAGE